MHKSGSNAHSLVFTIQITTNMIWPLILDYYVFQMISSKHFKMRYQVTHGNFIQHKH